MTIIERLRDADIGWSGDAACVGMDVAEEAAVEIERLLAVLKASADRVEKIAFSIKPPNPHTPELTMLAIGMREALAATMRDVAPKTHSKGT